jgi:predicted metal-dependent hydrolase
MSAPYEIQVIRSSRRSMSMEIRSSRLVVVRAPRLIPEAEIRRFLREKDPWIQKHLAEAARREEQTRSVPGLSWAEMTALGEKAVQELPARAAAFARTEDSSEFQAEIEHLRHQLLLMAETEQFRIKNVL